MGHWRKQCISFFVTSNCNLDCIYCYMPKFGKTIEKKDQVIDLDFAIAGMNEFFNWSKSKHIRFFSSGEATMEFERMKEIHEVALDLTDNELTVELQTNGFFGTKIAEWVENNVDILWISCDGPPEIHDNQRPTQAKLPSSPVIYKNIERFASNEIMQFGTRVTVLPENFDKQKEIIDFFMSYGVKNICCAPAYNSPINKQTEKPILLDFAKHYYEAYEYAQSKDINFLTHLMVNFDEKVQSYCRACTNPIHPQLTSDGYISCCDWASLGPKYNQGTLLECVYGEWDSENKKINLFPEAIENIVSRNSDYLKETACKGCSIVEHCAGGCIGKVITNSNNMLEKDPNWCAATRYLALRMPLNSGVSKVLHS